jgi:ABC-2 type transport system ATP-binding protein
MLQLNNITYAYQRNTPILKGVDLNCLAGEKHGILGRNGAGKTTLFRLLAGMMPMQTGEKKMNGQILGKSDVSLLEAEPYFYPYMTGMEYLRFIHDAPDQIERWNRLFDLPLGQYAEDYSTGMKKKLGLIGALLQDNRSLLILDEPYNGVDFESNEIIMSVLEQGMTEHRTVLVSSHILPTLTRICDRISVLQEGKISQTYSRSAFGELEKWIQLEAEERVKKALTISTVAE